MKKSLSLLFLGITLCSLNLASQNLIQGSDMEAASAASWIQIGGTDAGSNSQLVWGDMPNSSRPQSYKPNGFGTGGFFTFCVNWAGPVQYFMAQQVTVMAGTTYTFSFDYNVGDYSRAWLEAYMGTTDPRTVSDYTDNKISGAIIPWGEYQHLMKIDSTAHFSKDTTFTTNATFYVVIKVGCGWGGGGGEGYVNLSLDNVSLVPKATAGIENIGTSANKVSGGKSSLSATFEGTANVAVYSIQGQLIKQTTAQSAFRADGLPAGIYLVKIGNKTYKVVVQ